MTVKIDQNAGRAPRPLAEALVKGQASPFLVSLTHKNSKPLVVPSSGINTPIAPGAPVTVKVKSFEQAWLLVTDLAELARRAGNEAKDFAELTPAQAPEPTPEPIQEAAPSPSTGKASKPAVQEAK